MATIEKQAKQLRKKALEAGGTIASKATDLGGTVATKATDLGGTIASRVGPARDAVAPRAKELREALSTRTKETRRRVGYWIAGEEPPKRRPGRAALAVGIGAAAAFFLDPVQGKRRRALARDWTLARARALGGTAARGVGGAARGVRDRVIRLEDPAPPENDATLAHKVQSEAFSGLDLSVGQVNVNAENGIVVLRGAVQRPEQISELERRVRGIDGVVDVKNLLHLEGMPAPTTPA